MYYDFGRSHPPHKFGTIKIKTEIQKRSVDLCVCKSVNGRATTRSRNDVRYLSLVSLSSFY